MNEFLRQNKDLFSNKREFLTKLREVRQKFMNKLTHKSNGNNNNNNNGENIKDINDDDYDQSIQLNKDSLKQKR